MEGDTHSPRGSADASESIGPHQIDCHSHETKAKDKTWAERGSHEQQGDENRALSHALREAGNQTGT